MTAYGTICRNACGMNVMFSACRVNGSCSVNPNRIAPAISLIGLQLANTTSANAIQPMPFVVAAWCQAALSASISHDPPRPTKAPPASV